MQPICLNGGVGRSYFDQLDAFFALAEQAGSMQARCARESLNALTESKKRMMDTNFCATHEEIVTSLRKAFDRCERVAQSSEVFHEQGYGWDITVLFSSPRNDGAFTVLKYFWTAYDRNPSRGQFDSSRYVEVKLSGYILSLEGERADVLELANQAKLFDILPNSWYIGSERVKVEELRLVTS